METGTAPGGHGPLCRNVVLAGSFRLPCRGAATGQGAPAAFRPRQAAFRPLVLLSFFAFVSCFGAKADITLKRGGSGTISLEYSLSKELAELGMQEGNRRWLPLPLGPADFGRMASRIDGLVYRSGKLRERDGNLVSTLRLDFRNPEALAEFLGGRGSFSREGDHRTITLRLAGEEAAPGAGLEAFAREAAAGRFVEIGFSAPFEVGLSLSAPPPDDWTLESGRRARFRAPLADLIAWPGPLTLEISWREN